MSNSDRSFSSCLAVIRGLRWCAWPILIVGILTAGFSVYYTIGHLEFRTHRSDLLSRDVRLKRLQARLDQAFGTHTDSMLVVVEGDTKRRDIEFAEALAAELRKYPKQFQELFYRVDPERLKRRALLYLEPKELIELKDRILDHRRELAELAAKPSLTGFFQMVNEQITRSLIGGLFTPFLQEGKEKIPDLGILNDTLKQLSLSLAEGKPYQSPFASLFPGVSADFSQEGYFFTENEKYLLFLVTPRSDGFEVSERAVKLLREVVLQVKKGFPDIQAGVTGPEPLGDDEMTEATSDIALATWLSLFGQMILLILFLRSLKRPLVEGLVLIIGLCWTFGVTTWVVGHLNILSVIFAPLILGLTIDYGIHWYCRLEEEQGPQGLCTATNLGCTMRRATPAIFYAALVAAASFFPLVYTGFKGLAELGAILVLGVILMTLSTLVMLPSLVIVSEGCQPAPLEEECAGHPRPFLSLRWERAGLIVVLGILVAALGGLSLLHVSFDLNPLHLQNPKSESVVWIMNLIRESRYSINYGAMTAKSLPELEAKIAALKKLPTVSHVESILSFLPQDVEAKKPLLQGLKPVVSQINFPATLKTHSDPNELAAVLGRIAFKLGEAQEREWAPEEKATQEQIREANGFISQITPLLTKADPQVISRLAGFEKKFFADFKDKWELLQENLSSTPPRIEDLAPDLRKRFVGPGGLYLVEAFPSLDIWDPESLGKFVHDLRSVDPDVVGDPVLLYVFTMAFRDSCLWAAGIALIAVACMILVLFRSLKLTFLALLPLIVGTSMTLIMMWVLAIPFNQANVLFLPLILGEGVEFGIIILTRWRMEPSARAITLPASTAKGVVLAALTTTVGFGSLMVSRHPGVISLGLLATVGSLSVLLASLSVLPALLHLLQKSYPGSEPELHPTPGLRRWIWHLVKKEAQ